MNINEKIDFLNNRARVSLQNRCPYGPDVDLSPYIKFENRLKEIEDISLLPENVIGRLKSFGIDLGDTSKSSGYLQIDNNLVYKKKLYPNVEILSLKEALNDSYFVENYFWNLIDVGQDKFTAAAQLYGQGGYVIVSKENSVTEIPVQTCLFIKDTEVFQAPHNIVVAEPNSVLHVVTGCAAMPETVGLHAGITEFYVKKNSTVTFTMIHDWSKATHVRPRTAVVVEDGGTFINNYINLNVSGLNSMQSYPIVYLKGEHSRTFMSSIIVGRSNSYIDLGSAVKVTGKDSSAEIISRSVSTDSSKIVSRARISSEAPGVKGHIECRGLILNDGSGIWTVPELDSNVKDVDLTHEAAVGKLSEEVIFYLLTKGIGRDEAVSMLVRGFLEVKVPNLPTLLEKQIKILMESSTKFL
ncbi:MAG: SufD family Fe-S cluster assembly protein [Nitrososphaeria archaeon]|nr:SufD family Fe-S cluster assembly protein [Nitrososphaeria archaeon]